MRKKRKIYAPSGSQFAATTSSGVGNVMAHYEPITEEDYNTLLLFGEVPLMNFAFQNNAFLKIAEGRSIVQLGDVGPHIAAIKRELQALKYEFKSLSGVFDHDLLKHVETIQETFGYEVNGIIDAKTINAIDQIYLSNEQGELEKVNPILEPNIAEDIYQPWSEQLVKVDEEHVSGSLFKAPTAQENYSEDALGDRVFNNTILYVVNRKDGWVELRSQDNLHGYLPEALITPYVESLPEIEIQKQSKVYEEVINMINADTRLKNLDQDQLIGLIRSFTTYDQELLLEDEPLLKQLYRYFTIEEMVRALQGFKKLPLESLDTILTSIKLGYDYAPYWLYRNLLLKSEEGRKRERHYRNWFKAKDRVRIIDMIQEPSEITLENSFKRRPRYNSKPSYDYVSDQLFRKGVSENGFQLTPREAAAQLALMQHEIGERRLDPLERKTAQNYFMVGFRRNAIKLTLDSLDKGEAIIQNQYQDLINGGITAMRDKFKEHAALYKKYMNHVNLMQSKHAKEIPNLAIDALLSQYTPPTESDIKDHHENKKNIEIGRGIVSEFRAKMGATHPIFLDDDVPIIEYYKRVVEGGETKAVEEDLKTILDEKIESIDYTKVALLSNKDLIWNLEGLLDQAKTVFHVDQFDILDDLVKRRVQEAKDAEFDKAMISLAIALGLAVMTIGAGIPALTIGGALTVGELGTGLSLAYGLHDSKAAYDKYKTLNAANNTVLDDKMKLTAQSMSSAWVVVALVGVALDANALRGVLKALNTTRQLSPDSFSEQVASLVSKWGVNLSTKGKDKIVKLAQARKELIAWLYKKKGGTVDPRQVQADVNEAIIRNQAPIQESLEAGRKPDLISRVGDELLDKERRVAVWQRARYLVHHYEGNTEVFDFVKFLVARVDANKDIKTGINNLFRKLQDLHHIGKPDEALQIMRDLSFLQASDDVAKAFDDLLWTYTAVNSKITLSADEILNSLKQLDAWVTSGNMPLDFVAKLGEKFRSGALNSDSFNFIMRHWDELDDAARKAIIERFDKSAVDNYLNRVAHEMDETTDAKTAIKNLSSKETANQRNAKKLKTGKDLIENKDKTTNLAVYVKAAKILLGRSKIATNSEDLIKAGMALMETLNSKIGLRVYEGQILDFFNKLKDSPDLSKRYPDLVDWLRKENVPYRNQEDLANYLSNLNDIEKRLELMKKMGYQWHHITAVDTLMQSKAFRIYMEHFKNAIDFNAKSDLINSIPLLAKKNLSNFELGVHTNHEEMTAAFAAFLDGRWAKLKDLATIELRNRGIVDVSEELLNKTRLRLFDRDIRQVLPKLKEDILNRSVIGNNGQFTNVNHLFGTDLKGMTRADQALEVQKYLKEFGIDMEINTSKIIELKK